MSRKKGVIGFFVHHRLAGNLVMLVMLVMLMIMVVVVVMMVVGKGL